VNEKLGFDCIQLIIEADPSCEEIDECMRILNNFYRVYHEHLMILEEIQVD